MNYLKKVVVLLLVLLLGIVSLTTAQDKAGGFTITLTQAGTSVTKTIKVVQDITGLPLTDAKALVDALPDSVILDDVTRETALAATTKLDEIGAIYAVLGGDLNAVEAVEETELDSATDASADASAEEGDLYQVVLISLGDNSSEVVSVLRTLTSMTLAEAVEISRSTGEKVVLDGVTQDLATSAQEQLTAAGATIEIRAKSAPTTTSGVAVITYRVILNAVGDDSGAVTKAIESFTSLPSSGAADLVAQAPDIIVLEGTSLAGATKARKALQEAGASASVEKQ